MADIIRMRNGNDIVDLVDTEKGRKAWEALGYSVETTVKTVDDSVISGKINVDTLEAEKKVPEVPTEVEPESLVPTEDGTVEIPVEEPKKARRKR